MARRYTKSQLKAFIDAAGKVRNTGGTWEAALIEARQLGFKGNRPYLQRLCARARETPVAVLPESVKQRLREQYIYLVKCRLVRAGKNSLRRETQ